MFPSIHGVVSQGGAGGAPPFSPDDLANLALWLDASDSGTVTLNGSDVSAWADKSGNGRNMSQGSAALQPAYVTNAHNGLAALRFTGSEYLGIASDDLFRNLAAATVYFVGVTTSGATQWGFWSGTPAGNPTRLALGTTEDSAHRVGYRRLDADSFQSYLTALGSVENQLRLLGVHHDWQNRVGRLYVDGALRANVTLATSDGMTSDTAGGVRVGNPGNLANNEGWLDDICEVLVYRAFHSDTDRQKVGAYLFEKWGIIAPHVHDTFTDANSTALASHTPDIAPGGSSWAVSASGLVINSNQLVNTVNALRYGVVDSGVANARVTARLTLGTSPGQYAGFQCRFVDASNYWQVQVDANGDYILIVEMTNGSGTIRVQEPVTLGSGPYDAVVTLNGTSIEVTVNGVTASYISSQHQAATKHGVLLRSNGAGAVDEFKVEAL